MMSSLSMCRFVTGLTTLCIQPDFWHDAIQELPGGYQHYERGMRRHMLLIMSLHGDPSCRQDYGTDAPVRRGPSKGGIKLEPTLPTGN